MPEKIEAAELAYHTVVVERYKRAQALKNEIVEAESAFRSWGVHLHQKYELDIQGGEGVNEDGSITRAPTNPDPERI